MRVLYVTDTRVIGGAERYLATLAQGVGRAGHEVLTLAPQEGLIAWLAREAPGTTAKRSFSDGYHDSPTPLHRAGALLAQLPGVARTLRRLRPDVVHVNNGGFPGSDLCRIVLAAARLVGVERRVMTVHSNPWPRDERGNAWLQVAADRLVWSATHDVIAPSEAVAEGLQDRRGMPPGLLHTIYYGVARPSHDPRRVASLREQLTPAGELLVGMVSARPVTEKGYDVFIEALAYAGDRVRGVVVGPTPEGLIRRAHELGLRQRLTIAGPRDELGDYYAAFDLLAVPSTAEECMPLVIIEAASVGTPTFGSRLSGIPEAIEDGNEGRLFEPGDARALANLIDTAERDRRAIATMGQGAHRRWLRAFQPEAMLRSTLSLYEGLR